MDFYKSLYNSFDNPNTFLATVISGDAMGAKLLFTENEPLYSSSNFFNKELILALKDIMNTNKPEIINSSETLIFCEPLSKKTRVVICGAGHISISLIKMCKLLGLHVTVIDDRPTFVNDGRQAGADTCICEPFSSALKNIESDTSTFFIIVTRGHRYDIDCLREILYKNCCYTGMIGSKVRVNRIKEALIEEGFTEDKLNDVYTPIGLKIGAETPPEIAVSILAEIIYVKNKTLKGSEFPKEILNTIIGEGFENSPTALATIISRKGSAPRQVGTKMLVLKSGTTVGTIGGGCVESEIKLLSLDVIRSGVPLLKTVDMTGLYAEADGMVCGGIVEVFIEPINP